MPKAEKNPKFKNSLKKKKRSANGLNATRNARPSVRNDNQGATSKEANAIRHETKTEKSGKKSGGLRLAAGEEQRG